MSERFHELTKVPKQPAAKLLARAGMKLQIPIDAPASALPEVVLSELAAKAEWIELLKLLAVLLPPRERVWWACLAARDFIGAKSPADPLPLAAAEAWVFEPNETNRAAVMAALQDSDPAEDTVHCASAALYFNGTLGPDDMAEHPAPPGGAELSAFAMNVVALGKLSDRFDSHMQVLIDRALEIARGGSGRSAGAAPETEEKA